MARKTTPTHVLLNQIELSSTASSVTFSNIPQGYGDLVLAVDARAAQADVRLRINGDTGASYNWLYAEGNGSSGSSNSSANQASFGYFYVSTATNFVSVLNFMDYSATDKNKSLLIRNNQASARVSMIVGRWANTSAITSIELFTTPTGGYSAGTFSLYGVYA